MSALDLLGQCLLAVGERAHLHTLHTQAGFHPKLHLPFAFRAQEAPGRPLFYWVLWTLPFRAKGLQQKRHLLGYDRSRDTYKGT